ncbi:DUF7383 domain-containing protein [Halorussus halophilus]|uniref:DUF7383 domain-containing protein n=1 Tax=Halorussus halophilus TaxID=2650975 RepID=UPI001301344A|nr:hypothetical protein [Halorussus halophilus]
MSYRANYALVNVSSHLGQKKDAIDVPWADFVGDSTPEFEFEVPTSDAVDAYVGLQAFGVDEFGHELVVNDEALGGFDVPPGTGWQYWEDAITDSALVAGTNTLKFARDTDTPDSFAVNNVTVHWREPITEGEE